ncbi:MAG: PH domain-containing protein [Planctomycetes bacterium]|nr:PH domain-containing protein [Planctomycetota bacterium]
MDEEPCACPCLLDQCLPARRVPLVDGHVFAERHVEREAQERVEEIRRRRQVLVRIPVFIFDVGPVMPALGMTVRSGRFIRMHVPISGILAVAPSRNPLSAPAWSLDRLRIDYVRPSGRKAFLLISPRERTAFLDELTKLAKLERNGERWIRKDSPSAMGGDAR